MLAILGVDNPAIEAAYAAVPCEAFLRPPPWTVSSPFTGYRPLSGCDPVCCTRT
jgi:protein-L-isoaspartate(D-aspartate) O-methyltransferase